MEVIRPIISTFGCSRQESMGTLHIPNLQVDKFCLLAVAVYSIDVSKSYLPTKCSSFNTSNLCHCYAMD